MGARADLVVIEHGRRELYYSHWAATSLAFDLCWGPEHGVRFARSQAAADYADPDAWLDSTWCEGVAVIDLDNRVVAVGGGEGLVERRALMAVFARTWPGWRAAWAVDGICSLYDYLGIDRARAHSAEDQDADRAPSWQEYPDVHGTLLSTCRDGAVRWWTGIGYPDDELRAGPDAFAAYEPRPTPPPEWEDEPAGGVHADFDARTVAVWSPATGTADVEYLAKRCWPGFTVHRWYDAFESHNAAVGRELLHADFDPDALLGRFASAAEEARDWVNPAESVAAMIADQEPTLGPATGWHQPVAPPDVGALLASVAEVLHGMHGMHGPVPIVARDGSIAG